MTSESIGQWLSELGKSGGGVVSRDSLIIVKLQLTAINAYVWVTDMTIFTWPLHVAHSIIEPHKICTNAMLIFKSIYKKDSITKDATLF